MDWTKVTDAPSPEKQTVLITIKRKDGSKDVLSNAYQEDGRWFLCDLHDPLKDQLVEDPVLGCIVTHWAPTPAPAEDEQGENV